MYSKIHIIIIFIIINDNKVHCIHCVSYNLHKIKYNKNIL